MSSEEGTRVSLPPPRQSTPAPAPPPAPAAEPEEDLLRDVLDELDKERTKRAEVEADLRQLAQEREALQKELTQQRQKQQQQEQQQQQRQPAEADIISRQAFVAMEAQVRGFKQLVDALTLGKPAIATAAKQANNSASTRRQPASTTPRTLPLHVVRLLEVLPWDPRAREHIFGKEIIYEWQVYDGREQKWQHHMRHFPNRFKHLPLAKTNNTTDDAAAAGGADRSLLQFLAGGENKASKHGVLTDAKVSQILKIEAGYPLPRDGGRWEWVGGWRIEKRVKEPNHPAATSNKQTVDCDDDGWSYGAQVQDFEDLPTELVWDNPGEGMQRKIRRRQWSRQRVLVDYPFSSERTKQYLKLLAENARLTITATKMSDQLVETKTKLTETEEAMMQLKAEKVVEMAKVTEELKQQEEIVKTFGGAGATGTSSSSSSNQPKKRIHEFLQKNDQVKEIGSKISQWVARKSSEDMTSTGSLDDLANEPKSGANDQASASSSASWHGGESNPFNWRKVGRGGLIEKLAGKKSHGRSSSSIKIDDDSQLVKEEEELASLNDEVEK